MKTAASTLGLALALVLALVACSAERPAANVVRVGANPVPHAAILAHAVPAMAAAGYELRIVELTDYVQPNLALVDGSLEANYFQHAPYLAQFNADRGTALVGVARVHIEPLGLYSRRVRQLSELRPDAVIAIPNDPTNGTRARALLAKAGLGQATLRELDSAQLPRTLADADAAVINTNYALEAGLRPDRDALAREGAVAEYANLLVVRPELREDPRIVALARILNSPEIRTAIEREFSGAIVPAF